MKIDIPIIRTVDTLIIGGSTAAVEAALAAQASGSRVCLVSPMTYLGEDICAHQRYWLDPQVAETALAKRLFNAYLQDGTVPHPMDIKHTLEQAMINADAEFLYMSYPVALLRDENRKLAGAVIANRSGFQAIVAKAVIDATDRALVARMSSASFLPFPAGDYDVKRVVVGADTNALDGRSRVLPGNVRVGEGLAAVEYTITVQMADASPSSFGRAETIARNHSWDPKGLCSSDRIFLMAPDRLAGTETVSSWKSAEDFCLGAMQGGSENLFVLSNLASVSDDVAAELSKPCQLMAIAARLGKHVAELAGSTELGSSITADYPSSDTVTDRDVCREDHYFRFEDASTIPFDLNRVDVIAECDVAISGGGTAGAPAGIAAARAGAKALVLEYTPCLGGVGTEGRISCYYHGNRVGFTREIDRGVYHMGPDSSIGMLSGKWHTEWKKQWYLRECDAAGTEVWFGALTAAAAMDAGRVCGVFVVTPYGSGLVKSENVIDCSGNADVAAAAGAEVVNISKAHVAVQGTGVSPSVPGMHYTNADYTFVDDTDVFDVTRGFAVGREKFRNDFDLAQIINSRQRQQVKGELSLDPVDFLANRTFPDTVVTSQSNFDSHGFTIHPVFMAKAPDRASLRAHVPYRCLLPKGLEGILVTGLGVCSHRDALPVIRMQPDVQNQGYAAGRAAAMAARGKTAMREIDIKALQRYLIDMDILEPEVIDHVDSFPLADEEIQKAVDSGTEEYLGLAVIFSQPERSIPMLKEAWRAAEGQRRTRYAHILGLLGDDTGIDELIAAVDAADWDEGWHFTGMGQFGFSLSEIDTMLIALGRTKNPKALPTMLRKLNSLPSDEAFSHFRALTLAFEEQPTADATPTFAKFLEAFGTNSVSQMDQVIADVSDDWNDTDERNRELKELLIARGLFACGDYESKGRQVLENYRKDLHGHYARHAKAILGA